MNKDLTVGKPEVVLWKFSIPLLGSIIFQQLYNIADSLIAGRYLGSNALAAVGNSYEITLIYLAFAFGCNIGCSVIVSNFFGAKNYKDLKTAISTTFISTFILCIVLMLFGFCMGSPLLKLIDTPKVIFKDSLLYLSIYTLGLLFLFFYNIATGIFSALGDSKTPFYFLAFSSVANIFMDIVFVKMMKSVAGVAWATFLCQGVSCVLAVITVLRRIKGIETEIKEKTVLFSGRIFKKICVIAIPSILQQSFISVGNIIIQRIINGFGANCTAGYAAGIKLNNLVITSFTTLGNGMSNFTAQNMGAGKLDRVKKGYKGGLELTYLVCIPVVALYFIFGDKLVGAFMSSSAGDTTEAIKIGFTLLKILAPFYIVVGTKLISDGVLRGAGAMKLFMIGTFSDLILRVVFAKIFSEIWGSTGIWLAWPVGWSTATILSVWFYLSGWWNIGLNRRN